jgi:hypothetical protein
MNNTTKTITLAIAAIFIAATLVVGGTFAASSAFAYIKKGPQDNKKGARDNGSGNRNGNTITVEKCKNKGSASGFDTTVNQECENLICTHPGNNATCVSENEQAAVTPPVTPVTPPSEVGCPDGTLYNVEVQNTIPSQGGQDPIPAGTILCLPKKLGNQDATVANNSPQGTPGDIFHVVVAQPNQNPCNNAEGNSGFELSLVESGDPGNPIGPHGTVCIKENPSG